MGRRVAVVVGLLGGLRRRCRIGLVVGEPGSRSGAGNGRRWLWVRGRSLVGAARCNRVIG